MNDVIFGHFMICCRCNASVGWRCRGEDGRDKGTISIRIVIIVGHAVSEICEQKTDEEMWNVSLNVGSFVLACFISSVSTNRSVAMHTVSCQEMPTLYTKLELVLK